MQVAQHFTPRSDQIPRVRDLVRRTLRQWRVDRPADDMVLMASELFTNAVLHGAGGVELRLELLPDRVRIEVLDEGERRAPLQPVPAPRFSGRGLAIVAQLASDWGSGRAHHGGTCVWAELPRS